MRMRTWLLSGAVLCALLLAGCGGDGAARVVNTFAATPEEETAAAIDAGDEVVLETYYELSDGTWKADGGEQTYQYRLVLTGRLHGAVRDTTYTILSNVEDITFDQAWKASGLSSNTEDYFAPEEAVFVAIQ